jgi:hypothetical protein
MKIAHYMSNELHKTEKNGKPYYKMFFRTCSSDGYADTDEEAIEIFARWLGVPVDVIEKEV